MKTDVHFASYLAQFFLEWEMFQTKVVEKIKTRILCSVIFLFGKSYRLWENVEKILYSGTGHRWQYGACTLHAGYLRLQMHKLRLCNTHCFSTPSMVARTQFIVMLYLHCLYCWTQILSASQHGRLLFKVECRKSVNLYAPCVLYRGRFLYI